MQGLLKSVDFSYDNAYEYILHNNNASIHVAVKNGFVKVSNARYIGMFRNIVCDNAGPLGIYKLLK